MYFYYFLQSIKAIPKWFPSWIVTILQISQMFVGTFIVGSSMYYYVYGGNKYGPGECNNEFSNLVAGGLIYGSYLYLFCEFAITAVLRISPNLYINYMRILGFWTKNGS
eukprot:gene5476-7581_t